MTPPRPHRAHQDGQPTPRAEPIQGSTLRYGLRPPLRVLPWIGVTNHVSAHRGHAAQVVDFWRAGAG